MNKQALWTSFDQKDQQRINKAVLFLKEHFSQIIRRSGGNYAQHSCEVAQTLLEAVPDPKLQVIALLHDLLVHPQGEELLKKAPLSPKEKELIPRLDSLRHLHIDINTQDLDHVIKTFTNDSRLFLIRMAHRLCDVRQLENFKDPLKKQIAEETLYMYTALAGRLGLHKWRYEMEDICFKYLFPLEAKNLQSQFDEYKESDELCLSHAKTFLQRFLGRKGMKADIVFRIKNLYSTYRKMALKNRKFHDLTDRLALRILVDSREECYQVLGVIHEKMKPIPGKLKDYIGAPKANGYQSIHTVVYPLPGISERPIEIQIRTRDMDRECKYGFAAHHGYKSVMYHAKRAIPMHHDLFRSLELLRTETRGPEEFSKALRDYFQGDRIIVFNHREKIIHIPKESTVLDFVCITQPEKLVYLSAVKVNGRKQWIETLLQDGDMIEPSFTNTENIEKTWLSFVKTKIAKRLIKNILQQRA